MTCRGDAAATDWLLFGGGRASVRFRPPFLCPGQSRDGGPGRNSKRGAGRVSGQDGGGEERTVGAPGRTAKEARAVSVLPAGQENMRRPCGASGWWCSGQNCKRDAVRGGISDQAGEVAVRAALRGGGAPGRTAKGTLSVAAFQTKRERGRSVRCLGIRRRRQRSRQSEGRSGRRQPQRGRRGEGRSDRRRQRSKRGEGRSDRWPQRGRRGAGRRGPNW